MKLLREKKIDARLPTATLVLSNKMIDRKRLEAMWEEIKMLDIVEIAREKGMEEGKVLGMQEGKVLGMQEGKTLGMQEGKTLGMQEGKTLGMQEGKTLGIMEAAREMILDLLFDRFGIVPVYVQEEIQKVNSLRFLKALQLQAYRCADLKSFEAMLQQAGEASRPENTQPPRVN